jgi:thioesterase domain-containing protein
MGLQVLENGVNKLIIHADFELNRNHKMTIFGGSLATVLTLSCWGWLTNYLESQGVEEFEISVFKSTVEYNKPVTQDFTAICSPGDLSFLVDFQKMLSKKGKARCKLKSWVGSCYEKALVKFEGEFVAYKTENV